MYDTRVAAALGYLTRQFLEETGRHYLPDVLKWARGPARNRRDGSEPLRDPSGGPYAFPLLRSGAVHARSNVMSAWVLGKLAQLDCFAPLPGDTRVRAVESAFFMVGYDLAPSG